MAVKVFPEIVADVLLTVTVAEGSSIVPVIVAVVVIGVEGGGPLDPMSPITVNALFVASPEAGSPRIVEALISVAVLADPPAELTVSCMSVNAALDDCA